MTTTTTTPGPAPARPARVRVGYLVAGLTSLGLAAVWALWAAGLADGLSVSLLLPGVLVVAGVLGLLAMVLGGRRTASDVPPATTDEPLHDPHDETDQTRPYPTQEH